MSVLPQNYRELEERLHILSFKVTTHNLEVCDMSRFVRGVLFAMFVLAGGAVVVIGQTIPSWINSLLLGSNPLVGADPSSPTITDSLGFKFELYGSAQDVADPQNGTNEVISTNIDPSTFAVALRKLNPGVNIATLTNQLQLKYYFPSPTRTCGGGSPRFQLAIDTDGDGNSNGNAFGYVGHGGFGSGCVTGMWDFVDLADNVPARWDLTQFGLSYHSWATAVAALNTAFPNHRVLRGSLVDDTFVGSPSGNGVAYYDLVTIGHRTLENWQDTVH